MNHTLTKHVFLSSKKLAKEESCCFFILPTKLFAEGE